MATTSAISSATVVRILKLIRVLKGRPGKTLAQLGQLLDCHPRHARRYLDALEAAGFEIDAEGKPPRFYLFEDERLRQAEFTEEEAQLLQQAISNVPDSNPLLTPLRQKVFQHSTLFPIADRLADQHRAQVVHKLNEAIRDRRQVRLLKYESINSNTIADRIVEPHSLSDDFALLTAYEPNAARPEAGQPNAARTKTFRTARIEGVEILDSPQLHPPTEAPVDAFDWPGDPVRVSLALTPTAYRLLWEERLRARPDIRHVPDDTAYPYRYEGQVRSWIGIGRYILGIPGQVRIDAPEELREYVQGRVAEFQINLLKDLNGSLDKP